MLKVRTRSMHRALCIAEILARVFGLLEAGSNARNARVCKQWMDLALDAVWKAADPGVFRSLAPMEISNQSDANRAKALVSICYPHINLVVDLRLTSPSLLDFPFRAYS